MPTLDDAFVVDPGDDAVIHVPDEFRATHRTLGRVVLVDVLLQI